MIFPTNGNDFFALFSREKNHSNSVTWITMRDVQPGTGGVDLLVRMHTAWIPPPRLKRLQFSGNSQCIDLPQKGLVMTRESDRVSAIAGGGHVDGHDVPVGLYTIPAQTLQSRPALRRPAFDQINHPLARA